MLHCVHDAASQTGTADAMARFSIDVVPGGKKPPGVKTLRVIDGVGVTCLCFEGLVC
jgi:hypothetical protein